MRVNICLLILSLLIFGCKKEDEPGVPLGPTPDTSPKLVFKFRFDENQVRLNNLGVPATVPSGHAAQSPLFKKISAHYIEMTNGPLVPLGGGEVLYNAPETAQGGAMAIDFSQAIIVGENEVFLEIPISQIQPDSYEWMRVSLAYQNYDINFTYQNLNLTGRLASFVGYNTYIGSYLVSTQSISVNDDKLQGYWGMEVVTPFFTETFEGQSPQGATTVPNPLASTSPIPAGSCVVTGNFANPLIITGNETEDIVVTLSLSTNQSFEWIDSNSNGLFEPPSEQVVDMGLRGLIPIVE